MKGIKIKKLFPFIALLGLGSSFPIYAMDSKTHLTINLASGSGDPVTVKGHYLPECSPGGRYCNKSIKEVNYTVGPIKVGGNKSLAFNHPSPVCQFCTWAYFPVITSIVYGNNVVGNIDSSCTLEKKVRIIYTKNASVTITRTSADSKGIYNYTCQWSRRSA